MMANRHGDPPRPWFHIRLFCLAFAFTFVGVFANLVALQFVRESFELHDLSEPSEQSHGPVLASGGHTLPQLT
jgi:hypothetical protein